MVNITSRSLDPRERTPVPNGPHSMSGRFASAGIQTPKCSAPNLVVTPTVIPMKLYIQFQIKLQYYDNQGKGEGWSRAEGFVLQINVP